MAALSITDLQIGSDASYELVQFVQAANPGDVVYFVTAQSKWDLASTSTSTTAGADGIGIVATHVSAADDYGIIVRAGSMELIGATFGANAPFFVGSTAGEIVPEGDLGSSDFVTFLGVGNGKASTDEFVMRPLVSGYQK